MTRILSIIAVLLTIQVLVALVLCAADSYGEFEYRTANGQTGTAEYCAISYGQAHCRTADGENVVVESYRKVK